MDEKDLQIVSFLQQDGRISNAEIARRLGLAASAVLERIRKLEERGVIQGYTARLDPRKLGRGLLAFILVRSNDRPSDINVARELAALPEVLEVHHIAGEDCYLIKVRVADTDGLAQLMREKFGPIESIKNTRSTIVLQTLKETTELPIDLGEES